MKFETKWRFFLSLFAVVIVLSSCGGDDPEKSEEELQLDKLRGTWTMSSVENDDVDRTDEYPGMKITLSGTYTENGLYNLSSEATDWPSISPWKASDTWKFSPSNVTGIIVRQNDLLNLDYTLSNNDTQLTIEFDYGGQGYNNGGRTASVGGHWVFTFTK